jgi:predicted amidophosphoribosyltransferase
MHANTFTKCPYCDQDHPIGARFCPVTGKELTEVKTCPHCGEMVQAAS